MGVLRFTLVNGLIGTSLCATTGVAYLAARNPVISPLPPSDPIWSSALYARRNPARNPATQDVCIRRIPLDKIRPELLRSEKDLAVEFCRGIFGGWGYFIQRKYLEWKWKSPDTANQLWTSDQLATAQYDTGTRITDHFEVIDRSPSSSSSSSSSSSIFSSSGTSGGTTGDSAITIRCGDSPRNAGLRPSDGLFVISAAVDRPRGEVELRLTSCLFSSSGKHEGVKGPMPPWMEELHQWYARIWAETGSWRLLK